jgi:hypothetical protein
MRLKSPRPQVTPLCGIVALLIGSMSSLAPAAIPEGDSLSPWVVLPGSPPTAPVRIVIGSYASFPQPAVPGRVVRLEEKLLLDGVQLEPGTPLALAIGLGNKAEAWCVLPEQAFAGRTKLIENAWGGSIGLRHFKTAWGGSTRCIADSNGDGVFDTRLDGKFDSLGLPSIRRLSNALPLAAPVRASKSDPRQLNGYTIAATVIYADVSKVHSSACISSMPSEIHKPRAEIQKRFSIITLVRNDGTACFAQLDTSLRPAGDGQLAAVPNATLSNRGAALVVEQIDHDAIEVRLTSLFDPYVIATRTEREFVDY